MRPDRIIVGEVRGKEAFDMLQAMNTGHDGSLTTLHANSPSDALNRLETMILMSEMDIPLKAIRGYIDKALDLVVNVERLSDGRRKVTSISEIVGFDGENIILKDGDIINVDVSTILDGYYSDASRMFMIGEVSDEAKKLVEVARECMIKGIEAIKPWGFLGDIGAACGEHAHKHGYSIVRDLGGHGVGNEFHEDPFVPHVGKAGTGMLLVPGMVLTVEPMVNEGTYEVFVDAENEWTIYTDDDKLSAQWEHTILITETGVEILAY